ncbi:MAG: right-handed parallel beta-helix repeat-containing protein [Planctomycetota bacterium]
MNAFSQSDRSSLRVEALEGRVLLSVGAPGDPGFGVEIQTSVRTIYVDDNASGDPGPNDPNVSDPSEDGSADHPFDRVLEGVNAAANGDTVLILAGTYHEWGIDLGGKAITVTGANPDDPAVVAATILDGNLQGSIFVLDSSETSSTVITGLTMQDGGLLGNNYGGAIYCSGSSPTISKNIIQDNAIGQAGGGIASIGGAPTITQNSFVGNYGPYGGGIYVAGGSTATIEDNVFTDNSATYGGAIYIVGSSPTIQGNQIYGNEANGGGGIYIGASSSPTISHNTITGNKGGIYGGGGILAMDSSPVITSNTFSGNQVTGAKGGAISFRGSTGVIFDNILWDDSADSGNEIALASSTVVSGMTVTYCDVEGGEGGVYVAAGSTLTWGSGNIDANPVFADAGLWSGGVWTEGDYHLQSRIGRWDPSAGGGAGAWVTDGAHSPCIDAGQRGSSYSNEPEPNGDRVNMGAYGNTGEASKSIAWDKVDGDGDGAEDLGRMDDSGQWLITTSQGHTEVWGTWSTAVTWEVILPADFTGDGKVDIAGGTDAGEWWLAVSTGSGFTNQLWGAWSTGVTWSDVMVGDYTGDGRRTSWVGRTPGSGG